MTEGIVPARAGDADRKPDGGKKSGSASPDSLPARHDDLDSTIVYTARDSLIYNFDKRTADLYGKAKVDYKDMRVVGPRITVDHVVRTVHSQAASDSLGRPVELPVYTDKEGSFTAEVMTYNYKTRKGLTTNVSSKDDQGFYNGYQVKRMPSGELYLRDGNYTTCDLEEPHYWFAGKNMKIIPGDRLVARPLIMYIRPEIFNRRLPKVPLLPLPFMSVPISNKRASGVLVPGLGSDGKRGTYISDIGYFWAINDYSDLKLESDYAFNGSWRLGERFRYKVGKSVSGSIESEYETILVKHPDDPDHAEYKNWNTRIVHHQQFDPTAKLDVNLQYLGGDRYYDVNSINVENIITDQATSYASFSKSWAEGTRVFSLGYQRVDDLTETNLTQTLTGSLYQSQIYPFRSGTVSDPTDWSSRLYLQPSASFIGQFSHVDTVRSSLYTGNAGLEVGYQQMFAPGYRATFTQGLTFQELYKTVSLQEDLSGSRIQLPFKVQSTLFRYLTLTPSLTFSHYRVNRTLTQEYNGGVQSLLLDDPAEYSTTVFSIDAQTRLYASSNTPLLDKLVGIKAIRHTLIPTLTFTYNPDYQGSGYDYYGSYYNPVSQSLVRYNRFASSIYSDIPGERRYVGISIQNLFHGKFRAPGSAGDSGADPAAADKTLQLLSFTAATGYNFAADSLRIAPLLLTASSNALAPRLQMTAGAAYDFYSYNPTTGARINRLNVDEGKGLLRMLTGYLNLSVNFSGNLRSRYDLERESNRSPFRSDGTKIDQAIFRDRYSNGELVEFSPLLPWSLRSSIYLVTDRNNPLAPTTSALLNTSARIGLSRHWQAGVNTSYDLKKRQFIYPTLVLYRDLHDFQFRFQWVPSGEYRSYLLEIAMKAPQFKDLRYKSGMSY
ncbi:MAG: LPS-assembly protein LptD [Chlorobiaceae bacterium]|nr:LPS-assembly protein LptD [Chlorobiaceae bacterium]